MVNAIMILSIKLSSISSEKSLKEVDSLSVSVCDVYWTLRIRIFPLSSGVWNTKFFVVW